MSPSPPLVSRATAFATRTALIDDTGRVTYAELLERSARAASGLLAGTSDLQGARVALLAPPGIDYVVAQWATWRAGGVCVPLCVTHPAPELAYVLDDADVSLVIAHPELESKVSVLCAERASRGVRLVSTRDFASAVPDALPNVEPDRNALILYTSGTTGRPKGVVTTHAILAAQIESVVRAWEWNERDHIVHALPLHHLHGILNALCSALWSGATCELLPRFDAERVWSAIEHSDSLSLFMGVPTMYARLAQLYDAASESRREAMRAGCRRLRLMVSGSAALPVAMLERMRDISGHTLLERYGMTELGMVLGNPLHGERRAGHVGVPFPGVEARLVDDQGRAVEPGVPGEIQVRGPSVFREYWRKPDSTRAAFTADGFFRTGDVAVCEHGVYRILGRDSVDILKTGGFKVSALEIEEVLRTHPAIADCAVVGVPDEEWGQRVGVAVELMPGASLSLTDLREWGKERLAPYKVPTRLRVVTALPRNALGKVQKPEVLAQLQTGT